MTVIGDCWDKIWKLREAMCNLWTNKQITCFWDVWGEQAKTRHVAHAWSSCETLKKNLWVYCNHSIRLSSLICLDCPCICCHLLIYLKVLSFKLTRYVQHKWKHHIYNGSNAIKNNSTRLNKTGIPTGSRQTNWLGKNARDMRSRRVETPVRMVLRVNLHSESLDIRSSTEITWPLWLRKRRKINWLLIARVTLSCPIVSSCYYIVPFSTDHFCAHQNK